MKNMIISRLVINNKFVEYALLTEKEYEKYERDIYEWINEKSKKSLWDFIQEKYNPGVPSFEQYHTSQDVEELLEDDDAVFTYKKIDIITDPEEVGL